MEANFIIYEDNLIINNISNILEFNSSLFKLKIGDKLYFVKGNNLELKEVLNNKQTIKIIGSIISINKYVAQNKKTKSNFFKKLFR